MKKLMILGAGIYQVPLIKKAKEMGVYTIVVSIPGNYPGFSLADKVYYEDTTDYEKIVPIAREEKIDGIVTAGTDVAVITIGKVCDELRLKGLSFAAARNASNKVHMKNRYVRSGVRTANFKEVTFEEDINGVIENLKFPLIFKAVDSSGSRGIIKVSTPEEFEDAYQVVKEYTKKDYFIIEEFLDGEEFGAQAFVQDGKLEMFLPHGDYVFKGDTGVPVGHWVPYELEKEVIEDIREQLEKAVLAMELDNCAINADFMLCKNKAYVLEIGGRSGATGLVELVSLYYGYDYYEKIIQVALGGKADFSSKQCVPNVGKLLISSKTGIIRDIINQNDENDKDIYEIQFDYQVGDAISEFHIGPDRIGHVIVKGKTLQEAEKKIDEVISKIDIIVEEEMN